MVNIEYTERFKKKMCKISDNLLKTKVKKQVTKIVENPECGKPMRYTRKGTRELYAKPYRIAYAYMDDTIIFLDVYHKDEQ